MNQNEIQARDVNRRDFLKGGSVAALLSMLGGVELLAEPEAAPAEGAATGDKLKVGVIGLGPWGREIVTTLLKVPEVEVAALCDTYPASLRRAAKDVPNALQTPDYKAILQNKDIPAVIVATPTHKHLEIVLAALKADKQVYCEAPLANTIEDARAIALAAKTASKLAIFQAGLQRRADPQTPFLLKFIRSGAVGQTLFARAQCHKKESWRQESANPDREKEVNWRLDKSLSLGLIGERGCHALDQLGCFIGSLPTAVSGWNSLVLWTEDGRDVPDTVQAMFEFPKGVRLSFDATLGNSFEAAYEMLYGANAALMLRDGKAWMFKEVDSPLLDWEVYAHKDTFYKDTGIALVVDASKPPPQIDPADLAIVTSPLFFSLQNFARNVNDLLVNKKGFIETFGADDLDGLIEHLAQKVNHRPAAGYVEGFQATVTAIKANEALLTGQRIVLKPEWYEV
jgi:predicted dehydrogenase